MSSTTGTQTAQLKCQAGRGMFSHEAGILFRGAERNYESMLDLKFVHTAADSPLGDVDVDAWIEVNIVEVNCQNVLIELPRQTVFGGRRVWVPKSEVGM